MLLQNPCVTCNYVHAVSLVQVSLDLESCDICTQLSLKEQFRSGMQSILIKESVSVCNANKLPLFGGLFTTPPPVSLYYRITTVHVQRTLHIRLLRIRSTGTQVRGKPHFHNALTIVRAAPDRPTLVYLSSEVLTANCSIHQQQTVIPVPVHDADLWG